LDATIFAERKLVVVAFQSPLREDFLHFVVILHPLHRGGECGDPLDVALPECVATVSGGIFECAGLVILDQLDLSFRVLLHLRGDHRLVEQGGISAADGEFRDDLCPVLVALKVDALNLLDPFGVVGAQQRTDSVAF